jgi:hypothetical protein
VLIVDRCVHTSEVVSGHVMLSLIYCCHEEFGEIVMFVPSLQVSS